MEFLAHTAEDGRVQTLEDHLQGTSRLAGKFAAAFGCKEQGEYLGKMHDIGKYSDRFQKRIRGESVRVDHSSAGALESAKINAEWASFCIAGHHSGLPDGGSQLDSAGEATLWGRMKKAVRGGIEDYKTGWSSSLPIVNAFEGYGSNGLRDSFLIRFLYSALVDADYLDTERFMSAGQVDRGFYESLPMLSDKLTAHTSGWSTPTTELNRIRNSIRQECINAASGERGIYKLSVPTGGGKTISSMAFALDHAIHHGMDRIIYVIPYTSIIEQNAAVFRDIFGDNNVIEHHSSAGSFLDENAGIKEYRRALACENWDAPIIVTTSVQFFESFYANRSSKCRKLHNIANSVVIFDEAQMLPMPLLKPCIAAISSLPDVFHSTVMLCTATQPKLDDLIKQYAPNTVIREICSNSQLLSEKLRRNSVRFLGKMTEEDIAKELVSQNQVLCIVNSRKFAKELYDALPKEGAYHLSTLMTPAHRKSALAQIRERLAFGMPCRVISTSLIEAGVDVDFSCVYRELTGLDSIVQAAGRCNREGKLDPGDCFVNIFETENPAPALFRTNIGATREACALAEDPSSLEAIDRYFTALRSFKGDQIDVPGVIDAFERGLAGCRMPFKTVADRFRMIDDATKTVYIPLGEGEGPIERIRQGEHSRTLFRIAGAYSVNIYEGHYKALLGAGDITMLDEDSAILCNLSLYDENTGLSMDADSGKAQFI